MWLAGRPLEPRWLEEYRRWRRLRSSASVRRLARARPNGCVTCPERPRSRGARAMAWSAAGPRTGIGVAHRPGRAFLWGLGLAGCAAAAAVFAISARIDQPAPLVDGVI